MAEQEKTEKTKPLTSFKVPPFSVALWEFANKQGPGKRRTDSLLLGRAGQKMFHFSKGNVASTWRFVTISPSPETTYSAGGTLREGTLLWFHDMPSGERACSVVLYEPEGDV